MPKTRSNFTLSPDTIELLKNVENKSVTVEDAVKFYLLNKNEKKITELENVSLEL